MPMCRGVEFNITEAYKFYCPSTKNYYGSYQELHDALERKEKTEEATKRKKLGLKTIDHRGVSRTITGIHAGHGSLIVSPKLERYADKKLWPPVDWLRKAIEEKIALEKQVEILDTILLEFRLNSVGGGYNFGPERGILKLSRIWKTTTRPS